MYQIYKPNVPQLEVESFLKRYDKNQRNRNRPVSEQSSARASRRRREEDPSRAVRRRKKLGVAYGTAIALVEELAEPQAVYHAVPEAGIPELQSWLPEKAIGAYFGLCTLGGALDTHIRELTEDDLAAVAMINEVALAWIVTITQDIREKVRDDVQQKGLSVGAAYRPGLGRWPLQMQTSIFALLPAEEIGVTLTESMLMLPGFSTSVVIPTWPT